MRRPLQVSVKLLSAPLSVRGRGCLGADEVMGLGVLPHGPSPESAQPELGGRGGSIVHSDGESVDSGCFPGWPQWVITKRVASNSTRTSSSGSGGRKCEIRAEVRPCSLVAPCGLCLSSRGLLTRSPQGHQSLEGAHLAPVQSHLNVTTSAQMLVPDKVMFPVPGAGT